MEFAFGVMLLVLVAFVVFLAFRLKKAQERAASLERFSHLTDLEAETRKLQEERDALREEVAARRETWGREMETTAAEMETLSAQLDGLRGVAELESFGIYEPHFSFDTSERYKDEVRANRDLQKEAVRNGHAATCSIDWQVDGSKAKGRAMTNRQLKLMIRAFNGECDSAISKAKFNNVDSLEKRIHRAFEAINRLGKSNHCSLTNSYLSLKQQELYLAYEYARKKQDEKEEQRRIREEMKEDERARKEIEKAKADAEKEESRFEKALEQAREELKTARDAKHEALRKKIALLEDQYQQAHDKKANAIARARLTKSGHVYVISNIGSFGENVFKIGMTRRLFPIDRVKELGDASVPFPFDVHAMIYSDDAPGLESQIQRELQDRQVNLVNPRKEFFAVDLGEIESLVKESCPPEVEFITTAVAEEYRESAAIRRKREQEAEQARDQAQAAEVQSAQETIDRLKESWKAEPI